MIVIPLHERRVLVISLTFICVYAYIKGMFVFPNFVNRRIRKVIYLLQFQYIILGGLVLFLLRVDDSAKLFEIFFLFLPFLVVNQIGGRSNLDFQGFYCMP